MIYAVLALLANALLLGFVLHVLHVLWNDPSTRDISFTDKVALSFLIIGLDLALMLAVALVARSFGGAQ